MKELYTCEFTTSYTGSFYTVSVEAESYKEAVELAEKLKKKRMLRVWKGAAQTKQIVDAENILLEMDANNSDEIIINEGIGCKTTYTRKQIEESISSDASIKKFRASKARAGLLD